MEELVEALVVDPLKEYNQKPKNAAKTLFSDTQMPQNRYSPARNISRRMCTREFEFFRSEKGTVQ